MSVDYETFFDRVKVSASVRFKMESHNIDLDVSTLNAMSTYEGDVENSNELSSALSINSRGKTGNNKIFRLYGTETSKFLQTDGRDLIQSSKSGASSVAEDLKVFMLRDSETVLDNVISNVITYARQGDGIVTITQDQGTRNDTITLSCITAQNGGDAVFSVRSKLEGNISTNVTADGTTSYVNAKLGIAALIIDEGSVGNEWAVSDTITITTTSDNRSILLNLFRDLYSVVLPTSGTPTIDNTFIDVVTTFPVSPLDGDEVVLNGVRFFYSFALDEWIESCL